MDMPVHACPRAAAVRERVCAFAGRGMIVHRVYDCVGYDCMHVGMGVWGYGGLGAGMLRIVLNPALYVIPAGRTFAFMLAEDARDRSLLSYE